MKHSQYPADLDFSFPLGGNELVRSQTSGVHGSQNASDRDVFEYFQSSSIETSDNSDRVHHGDISHLKNQLLIENQ